MAGEAEREREELRDKLVHVIAGCPEWRRDASNAAARRLLSEHDAKVRAEERERAAKDVCAYCGKRAVPDDDGARRVLGPNAAGNYFHEVAGQGPMQCKASPIWARHFYALRSAPEAGKEKP